MGPGFNIHRLRRFVLLALLPALAGCVQVEQTLTLKPDGSGTFAVRYGMALETVRKMDEVARQAEQMAALTGEKIESSSPFEFNEADIRRDFESYRAQGIILDAVRIQETNGWKQVDLAMSFKSLEGLLETEFLSDRRISLTRNEQGQFELLQAPPVEAMSMQDLAGVDQEAMRAAMADMMKGFRAVLHVEVPGPISITTADRHDEHTATWEFDLDKDPGALERAQTQVMRIVFEGAGLSLPEYKGVN